MQVYAVDNRLKRAFGSTNQHHNMNKYTRGWETSDRAAASGAVVCDEAAVARKLTCTHHSVQSFIESPRPDAC